MESVRREPDEHLQALTAARLARLLDQCTGRTPCPNDKVLANLCAFLRCDPEFTPVIRRPTQQQKLDEAMSNTVGNYEGIVTLDNQQKNAERAAFKKSNGGGRGPGRPPATDIPLEELFREEDEVQKANKVQRRGATLALTEITRYFG